MTPRDLGALRLIALLMLPAISSCDSAADAFLPEHPTIDILIENGEVLDGLGNEPAQADVVISGDTIVFIGDARFSQNDLEQRVRNRIDATGKSVAPGFIDLHSHGDPLETPAFENFLAMGVTTISLGQDGSSPETVALDQWLEKVDRQGLGPNLAMFIGHGTLRTLSGTGLAPVPSAGHLDTMLGMLDGALDYTFGMSTGLEYNPGLNVRPAELRALARVVGRHDRVIMSHMRNEDDDQLERSIAELLEQGEHARVHISHLKSVFGQGTARADEILAILDDARRSGIEISADVYPYTASYTGIGIVFPVWAKTKEQFDIARRERRGELATYLRQRVEKRNGPEATLLGTGPYKGKTLAELSFEHEMPFEEVLIDVIGPQGASAAYFVMNEELQARLLQRPYVSVCSDGSPMGFHPRGHGAFAKIIEHYVVRQRTLSLQEAVRKMTSFPATILGIGERGRLQPGKKADVIIFDPAEVRARATYAEPLQLAEGFEVVIVNGEVARMTGRMGDRLPGRVLRPQASRVTRASRPESMPGG